MPCTRYANISSRKKIMTAEPLTIMLVSVSWHSPAQAGCSRLIAASGSVLTQAPLDPKCLAWGRPLCHGACQLPTAHHPKRAPKAAGSLRQGVTRRCLGHFCTVTAAKNRDKCPHPNSRDQPPQKWPCYTKPLGSVHETQTIKTKETSPYQIPQANPVVHETPHHQAPPNPAKSIRLIVLPVNCNRLQYYRYGETQIALSNRNYAVKKPINAYLASPCRIAPIRPAPLNPSDTTELARGTPNGGPQGGVQVAAWGRASPGCIRTCRRATGKGVSPYEAWGYRTNQEGVGVAEAMSPPLTQLWCVPTLGDFLRLVWPERRRDD